MKKNIFKISFLLIILVMFSCQKFEKVNLDLTLFDNPKIFNCNLFKNSYIIVPKNQSNSQDLSIIVKTDTGKLLVFDGGRIEDSDYLVNIIKTNGGVVDGWFLTHIHDDHIGALYKIFDDKNYDITIKNLYYSFADFDWYYKMIGDDAGIVYMFEDKLKKYGIENCNTKIEKNDIFEFDNVYVEVLNSVYTLNEDSINNSSICYRVNIEDKNMLILGDLAYEGGFKLLKETDYDKFENDILVLAHHGQNGVPTSMYYHMHPKVIIWPTSEDIYINPNGKYNVLETKEYIQSINCKNQVFSYMYTGIIR